jgi:hypothetical protein
MVDVVVAKHQGMQVDQEQDLAEFQAPQQEQTQVQSLQQDGQKRQRKVAKIG